MKTLYLHIGTQKTATTSLQNFCMINQQQFHKYNYSFPVIFPRHPQAPIRRNAHFLADASPNYDATGCIEVENDNTPDKQALREKRLSTGLKAVHKAFKKYDNVILTDEDLWLSLSYGKRNPLDILLEDGNIWHYGIKVIVYLRRQDQFLSSRWNQFVKHSTTRQLTQTFPEYLDDVLLRWPLVADYAGALDNIARKIGKENLIIRRFESSSWIDGSVYKDFLTALGLDPNIAFKLPKEDSNTSLTLNYVEIQRQLNLYDGLNKNQKQYLEYYLRKASSQGPQHKEYSILSMAETQEFLARYNDGNNRIVKEYLKEDAPLFSGNIKGTKKWEPYNEHTEKDLCYYLSLLAEMSEGRCFWKYKYDCFRKSVKRLIGGLLAQ
ncbi:MAG: hypothetical protein LIP10_09920 [Clostridiales bacterium]|nr:hypothetical protein [Clostridiales bacterium]